MVIKTFWTAVKKRIMKTRRKSWPRIPDDQVSMKVSFMGEGKKCYH